MQRDTLWVIGMDSHSSIPDHGFRPGGGHHNLLVALCQGVGKGSQDAKLDQLLVAGHMQLGGTWDVLVVYLSQLSRQKERQSDETSASPRSGFTLLSGHQTMGPPQRLRLLKEVRRICADQKGNRGCTALMHFPTSNDPSFAS